MVAMNKGSRAREAETWQRICESPAYYRANVLIDAGGTVRRFGDVCEPWQQADFAPLDPAWLCIAGRGPRPTIRRAWLERPRGHSKTGDIAMSAVWALLVAQRKISGVVAAADREQAAFIRDAIERLAALNPWIAARIDVQREVVRNPATGGELSILTSDVSSSYGLTPDFVICDEVTHWAKRDLFDSLFSAAAKRPNCLFLCIQNAGFADSWQWELREKIRVDANWHFRSLNGPQASWISTETLAEQRHLLPEIAYRRLWLNQWSEGSGDALTDDDLKAAITLAGPAAGPEPGWSYVAGLDLGVSKDASALVVLGQHVGEYIKKPTGIEVVHPTLALLRSNGYAPPAPPPAAEWRPGTGRLKLVACQVWQPSRGQRVSLDDVKAATLALHKQFGFSLGFDPSQAILMGEQLQAAGVFAVPMPFVPENLRGMCQATLDAFTERQIDLYEESRLLSDLRSLRVAEKGYGVRLTSPRGPNGHGDAATALSIAALMAKRFAGAARVTQINRPLVCWP
jgi:phage terminase large subunit-like protein